MPAQSLLDTCMRACVNNYKNIDNVGCLEYFQIKPLLERINDVEHLHRIEENSPQIKGDDKELWQRFIARDFPNWKEQNYAPKDPTKWYLVYQKYFKERQRKIKRDEEILKQAMSGLQKKREENVSKVMDLKTLPKLPLDNGGAPSKRKRNAANGPSKIISSLTWSAGSRTKMTDGKSVLSRAMREAKEIGQMSKLSRPTHRLTARMGQVTKAPAGMVQEYQTANKPAHTVKILSSRKSTMTLDGKYGLGRSDLEEREERLRQAMKSKAAGSKGILDAEINSNVVSFSDEEESTGLDSDELDTLFDQPAVRPAPKGIPSKRLMTSRPDVAQRPQSVFASKSSPASGPKKPSDLISSILSSKPRPTVNPAKSSTPHQQSRIGSTITDNKAGSNQTPPRPIVASSTRPSNPVSSSTALPKSQAMPTSLTSTPKASLNPLSSSPPNPSISGSLHKQSTQPATGGSKMIIRKRKEVDIFNRGPKRPRSS